MHSLAHTRCQMATSGPFPPHPAPLCTTPPQFIPPAFPEPPRTNFDSIVFSLLTVCIVATGEGWNDVFTEVQRAVGMWSVAFFISLVSPHHYRTPPPRTLPPKPNPSRNSIQPQPNPTQCTLTHPIPPFPTISPGRHCKLHPALFSSCTSSWIF